MSQPKGLYAQLDDRCTIAQIVDFMRPYKEVNKVTAKEVLISGKDKAEILDHLRRAIGKKHIPLEHAIDLLRKHEECGHQHVFYYKVREDKLKEVKFFSITASRLFGDEWDETFPIFDYPKKDYRWVDARNSLLGKPNDWLLKLYGIDVKETKTKEERKSSGVIVRTFEPKEFKVVSVIRWNNPDLLEIRIDSEGITSVRQREARLAAAWKELEPAIKQDWVVEWDLGKKAKAIIAKRGGKDADYSVGNITVSDRGDATHHIHCATSAETIDDVPTRSTGVNAILADSGGGKMATVRWKLPPRIAKLPDKSKELELTTVCGGRFINEMTISSRITPEVLDYVTNRLRDIDR